jgi:hypothetical protein
MIWMMNAGRLSCLSVVSEDILVGGIGHIHDNSATRVTTVPDT